MAVYAEPSDVIASYDVAILGQLCTDTDVAITPSQLPLNVYMIGSIRRASADIRQAAQVGERYTDDDLDAIYASTDPSVKFQIVGLCVDRAFGYLLNRRAQIAREWESLSGRAKATDEMLEALRHGYRLFTLAAQKAAGSTVEIVPVEQTSCNSIVYGLTRFFPSVLPDVRGPVGGCSGGGCG